MSRITANLLLLLAGLVWGLGFVAQETAMEDIGPFQFVALRFLLAALVVAPFAWREFQARKSELDAGSLLGPRDIVLILAVGTAFFLGMILQQIGLLGTSVTNAGMLTGLYVVLVPILSLALFRERQPMLIWPMSLLAFGGIWFLGGGGLDRFTWGDAFIITCALFWAFHVMIIGKAVRETNLPVLVATLQFALCGCLAAIGFVIAQSVGWSLEPAFSQASLLAAAPEVLYSAIFAGGLAFTLQAIGQRYTGPAVAAVLLSSESLFAAAGGAILLGERLDWMGYLGCAMLFTAIVLISVADARKEEAG